METGVKAVDHDLQKIMTESFGDYFGPGSEEPHRVPLIEGLPYILEKYEIKSVNDAGCGEGWVRELCEGIDYCGFDIVQRENAELLDITSDIMPEADLIICRDVLFHLTDDLILESIENFKKSSKYLLTTSQYDKKIKRPKEFGGRAINAVIDLIPILGEPLEKIEEPLDNRFLGLWSLQTTKSSIS